MTNLQNAPQSHQQTPQRARRAALDKTTDFIREAKKTHLRASKRVKSRMFFLFGNKQGGIL